MSTRMSAYSDLSVPGPRVAPGGPLPVLGPQWGRKSSLSSMPLAGVGGDVPPVSHRLPLRPPQDEGDLRGGDAPAAAPRRGGGPRTRPREGRERPAGGRGGNRESIKTVGMS